MDVPWLEALEGKVREAVEELRRLREENAELQDKIRGLEEQLESLGEGGGEEAWAEERDAIRERVETLVETLEDLLEDE